MYKFILRKVLVLLFSLFFVSSLTFFLMRSIPGTPFLEEQGLPEEVLQSLCRHYGLDQPWHVQYGRYLKGLITWDLGPSIRHEGLTVTKIIKEGFPISCIIGLQALIISLVLGVLLGVLAAIYRGKWQDHACMIIAVLGISTPNFVTATILQFFLAMQWEILPIARWGSFAHSLLPALSLSALPTAFIARLIRANMVEELEQDYDQMARSKGLSEKQVIFKHVLKNSILPVVTYLGPLSSSILTGSFVIEKIFGIPGLGSWLVKSIANRDYTLIMGMTVFYSSILLITVFLIDLLYLWIDPRIRIGQRQEH